MRSRILVGFPLSILLYPDRWLPVLAINKGRPGHNLFEKYKLFHIFRHINRMRFQFGFGAALGYITLAVFVRVQYSGANVIAVYQFKRF
jgi:hypothetical protein